MDRKLISIENYINDHSVGFRRYLDEILPSGVLSFVNELQSKTHVYLFSGIIRNYFLKNYNLPRDIDFIFEDDLDIKGEFPALHVTRNSFDGYKTKIESLPIDLWSINKTWGLKQGQLHLPFKQLEHLPNTTFFNFSSIVYSMNDTKFIVGKPFLRFLRDRKLDIVLEKNPYPALCIINSFYYCEKFNLKLSNRLKNYIVDNYSSSVKEFTEIQRKHFAKIIYSKTNLLKKVDRLKNAENNAPAK